MRTGFRNETRQSPVDTRDRKPERPGAASSGPLERSGTRPDDGDVLSVHASAIVAQLREAMSGRGRPIDPTAVMLGRVAQTFRARALAVLAETAFWLAYLAEAVS